MGLLSVMALVSSVSSNPGDPVAMSIWRGQYRMAVQNIFRRLEADPDDPDLYCMLGVAWSRSGYMADALGAFTLSVGGDYYEEHGVEAHANALRETGAAAEALSLRRQQLTNFNLSEGRMVRVFIGLVDDARSVGDISEALYWAEMAESVHPRAPVVHAAMADVMMDAGDFEAADHSLWQSQRFGTTRRGVIAQARRSLILGNLQAAEMHLEEARALNSSANDLAAWRAEVQRLQGFPEMAQEILDRSRWELTEYPLILAIRIRVAVDLNNVETATIEADRARSIYGEHVEVQRSLAYLANAR